MNQPNPEYIRELEAEYRTLLEQKDYGGALRILDDPALKEHLGRGHVGSLKFQIMKMQSLEERLREAEARAARPWWRKLLDFFTEW